MVRLAVQALFAGVLVALLAAGAGWSLVRDAEVGTTEAMVGAAMLLGAPAFGGLTALVSGVVGFMVGRSARRRRPVRRTAHRAAAVETVSAPRVSPGQHQLIAMYRVRAGTIEQVARQAEGELAGLFRKRAGFVAYEFIRTGDTEAVSVSTWESRDQAEAAVDTAVAWATIKVARAIVSMENHVGAVMVAQQGLVAHPAR
jgi:heme-degrading monooxygenase HmoA